MIDESWYYYLMIGIVMVMMLLGYYDYCLVIVWFEFELIFSFMFT